jgi:cystathionine beta-synthase
MLETAEPLAFIGDTPMIELTSLGSGPCRVFAKLESRNPTGSIKDRIAMSMVDAAERSGALKPRGRPIEATARNRGWRWRS